MLQSPREEQDDLPELDLDGLDIDGPDPVAADAAEVSDDCVPLDDSKEQVGYELLEWDATELDLLDDLMHERKVPHEWVSDGFELVVHEDDETLIDALLPEVRFPDELPVMEDDDDETPVGVLSALFDAADRISRDAHGDGVSLLLDTAEQIEEKPPFGIALEAWDATVAAVDDLIDGLHADAPVDAIQGAAASLRDRLRPIV